ncbi:NAD-dependent deacetylase [Marinospirillum celere]|uniref:NAD-dependent protein deacylase n=1 Tax=Marinospirillum celere TaxID=1122252 RepID=A0A1I1EM14_9GAMM|nr:NAD-dependent deacylase [Marinospirillum celere]SFB87692.1 NAD-dependent deacetylase [Marinospirillum celere]
MSLRNLVVLTGAGISAESGISTFRDQQGLWEKHSIEEVATPEAFARDPEKVLNFYNQRRAQLRQRKIKPNPAHKALASFEKKWLAKGGQFLLISQNVDNLHVRAGSQRLVNMHGQLMSALCPRSGRALPWQGDLTQEHLCECCDPPQLLRPDIVWFGEVPYHLEACYQALEAADLFISIGTSGQVYPAAGFMQLAQQVGAQTVEINLEKTSDTFEQGYYGPASQEVPRFFKQLLA